MNGYKISQYIVPQQIESGDFLCSNIMSGKHIILSGNMFKAFQDAQSNLSSLEISNPNLFNRLKEGKFIIETNIDEFSEIQNNMIKGINDRSLYQIIINPTLDCNLSCWYCYENKIIGSKMHPSIIDGICKHIVQHYSLHPFTILKLSFFGGEPTMYPDTIIKIASFAKEFCAQNSVGLLFDFTTNGTLISESLLNSIKDHPCLFQITLDGNRARHNKIKFSDTIPDAFSATLSNIHLIQRLIPASITSVRINFDSKTLSYYEEILSELDALDRLRTKIILKKVWQVDSTSISKERVMDIINMTLQRDFSLDYYNQGGICFADRNNQVTFNYNGGIYKCTTISHFNNENALGSFQVMNGKVVWDDKKTSYLKDFRIPEGCKSCKLLPSCGGPCRKKLANWKPDDCFLKIMDLTIDEYILIQLQIELTNRKILAKYGKK